MTETFYTAGDVEGSQTLVKIRYFKHIRKFSAIEVDGEDAEHNEIRPVAVAGNYRQLMERIEAYHAKAMGS